MQGRVEICGVKTSRLKVLKNEETMELLRCTKTGDMDAREQLIAGNLRLVLCLGILPFSRMLSMRAWL